MGEITLFDRTSEHHDTVSLCPGMSPEKIRACAVEKHANGAPILIDYTGGRVVALLQAPVLAPGETLVSPNGSKPRFTLIMDGNEYVIGSNGDHK